MLRRLDYYNSYVGFSRLKRTLREEQENIDPQPILIITG